ncbi:hypothetical protein FVP60_09630 [Microbacterium mitrae]|uniref:Uncharacterized protein n=1 Tax=Microbacterium mitrae TaxID=664640 RepID=A0A5C8HLN2_9MICO|nr:hypothetical protein FVP60_09630 [Microbacterium mitrae]
MRHAPSTGTRRPPSRPARFRPCGLPATPQRRRRARVVPSARRARAVPQGAGRRPRRARRARWWR